MFEEATLIPRSDFASRRARLMQALPDGAIILAAGHEATRNHDVNYVFRQHSGFWYLMGLDEPDAVAVLRPGEEKPYTLFLRPKDPQMEVWVGPRVGVEAAPELLGADEAFPIEKLDEELPKLLEKTETLYYSLGTDDRLDKFLLDFVRRRRAGYAREGHCVSQLVDPKPAIDRLRLIKSPAEIAALQRAIDITAVGFAAAFRTARPGVHEYEVQAELEREFRRLGSQRNGYPSIVAGGAGGCVLHYIRNRKLLKENDLLLMDAGAEHEFYTADVTRTWPVSGRFTPEQRAVYDIVLEAQRQAIAKAAPETPADEPHKTALRVLTQGLLDLGALEGDLDKLIEDKAYRPFFMHGTSHWLGLDVHDAGAYKQNDKPVALQPGMALTVEPGLYFGALAEKCPEHLRGIGVRIEDDILVTPDGCRVLSAAIPKSAEDMENAARG